MDYSKAPISSLRHSVKDSLVYADAISEFNLKITVNEYGSANKFINSLEPVLINSPNSLHLKDFYKLYKEFFILPDERESLNGFKKVLSLNTDRSLNQKFGDFEECMLCLLDPKSKTLLGALDFCNYPASKAIRKKYGVIGFVQLVFLFVREDFRKFGIAKKLLTLVEEYYSKNFFLGVHGTAALRKKNFSKGKVLFFCEQNNPKRMTVRKQLIDSLGAKILQDDRVEWWKNRGYKQLQFDYFQPPLSSKLKPSNELVLRIKSPYKKEIPAQLVWNHLNAFFSISILKGKNPLRDKTYVHQKKVLQKLHSIKIRN